MASKVAYLASMLLSGAYIAWSVAEGLSLHYAKGQLTPYASLCPPWVALMAVPIFLLARTKHYWLRATRTHGGQAAAVYPHRDPVLGSDWIADVASAERSNTILERWDELFELVGSTYWVQNIGEWLVMTNEPENVKALLASQFEAWPIGGIRKTLSVIALGPHAIFSVNGPQWQSARALIRPTFVRDQIADLKCTERHVENLLARFPKDGSSVDLQGLLYMFMMDMSTDFMFGHSTNTLVKPTPESLEFAESFDYSIMQSASRSRYGWFAFLMPSRKLDAARARCQRFADGLIAQAQADDEKIKERPYVFMTEMLASGAPREAIRDQLLAMILGGRDTSASTLNTLFWTLARRPDVVRKLRVEVEALEGRRPTWEELRNMPYLNMVLKEILRLYAPVPANSRCSDRDIVLPKGGGPDGQSPLFVPKGTTCRWSSYSLHRRKDVFGEDADEFRPERWETIRPAWGYSPFSGGPRVCVGQQFALTQMSYLVTRVFQVFKGIDARDELPMKHVVSTTMSLEHGCWVGFEAA